RGRLDVVEHEDGGVHQFYRWVWSAARRTVETPQSVTTILPGPPPSGRLNLQRPPPTRSPRHGICLATEPLRRPDGGGLGLVIAEDWGVSTHRLAFLGVPAPGTTPHMHRPSPSPGTVPHGGGESSPNPARELR